MSRIERDEAREERISDEIIVDAYGPEEQSMGWYYYLDEVFTSEGFLARCRTKRAISPLQVGDDVEVLRMAPENECHCEMFVMIRWEKDGLGVPLSQLKFVHGEEECKQAIEDWCYWVDRGYTFY